MNWDENTPLSVANLNGLELRISNATISVANGKETIASAITAKGVPATVNDTFAQMATKIQSIEQAEGNAQTRDVSKGKTFSSNNGVNLVGTGENAKWYKSGSINISAGETVWINQNRYAYHGITLIYEAADQQFFAVLYEGNTLGGGGISGTTWEILNRGSYGECSVKSISYSGVLKWETWGYDGDGSEIVP